MKLMKKALPLALVALLLAGCGKSGYVGSYLFQMGKNSGAHVTANIDLYNDDYIYGGVNYGKKMLLKGQVQTGPQTSESSSSEESSLPDAIDGESLLSGGMETILRKGLAINGYYTVGEDRPEGRKHLQLGFSLDFLAEMLEIEVEEDLQLPPEVLQNFIYGEIDSRKIYLQIPVSFADLQMQLYWYGIDFNWLTLLDQLADAMQDEESSSDTSMVSSESSSSASSISSEGTGFEPPVVVEAHEPGTKPTQDDINEINKTYPQNHGGEKFRNFYTISLGLTRQ